MREDPTLSDEFIRSQYWQGSNIRIFVKNEDPNGMPLKGNSYSGHERNRLFMQRAGDFDDLTLVSGASFSDDCRSTVIFDFDQDGFLDMGVCSNQNPKFRLMKNQLGSMADTEQSNRALEIRLVGGQSSDTNSDASEVWTNRDGIGAKVFVHFAGDKVRMFESSCGEGLAAQNSSKIHVGLAADEAVERIEVLWPSGRKSTVTEIESGKLVTISERD